MVGIVGLDVAEGYADDETGPETFSFFLLLLFEFFVWPYAVERHEQDDEPSDVNGDVASWPNGRRVRRHLFLPIPCIIIIMIILLLPVRRSSLLVRRSCLAPLFLSPQMYTRPFVFHIRLAHR